MSLYKKTMSLYAGSRVPIQKINVPIGRGPCTRASLVQGLLEDPGRHKFFVSSRGLPAGNLTESDGSSRRLIGIKSKGEALEAPRSGVFCFSGCEVLV